MPKIDYAYTPNMLALSIWGRSLAGLYTQPAYKQLNFLSVEKASAVPLDWSWFESISELWVDSKEPFEVPEAVCELRGLRKLIFAGGCRAPQGIHHIDTLEELWTHDSASLQVPPASSDARGPRALIMSYANKNCQPQPMPGWVYSLERLESLRLTVNAFTEITPDINQLRLLKSLDLGCSLSHLQGFPDLSGLQSLEELDAHCEAVQGWPKADYAVFADLLEGIRGLTGLKRLNLAHWRPKQNAQYLVRRGKKVSIPDVFANLRKLESLDLSNLKIDFLPDSIVTLPALRYLNLCGNRLSVDDLQAIRTQMPRCAIDI